MVLHCGLPMGDQQDIQEHVTVKCEGPWHAAKCGGNSYPHGMHCSCQSLIKSLACVKFCGALLYAEQQFPNHIAHFLCIDSRIEIGRGFIIVG